MKKGLGIFDKKSRKPRFEDKYRDYDRDYQGFDEEFDPDDDFDMKYEDEYEDFDDYDPDEDYDGDEYDRDYEDDDYDRDYDRDEYDGDDDYRDDDRFDDDYDRDDRYDDDYDRDDRYDDDYDRDDRYDDDYDRDDRYDDDYDRDDRYDDDYDLDDRYDDRYEDEYPEDDYYERDYKDSDREYDAYAPKKKSRGKKRSRRDPEDTFFAVVLGKIKSSSAAERVAVGFAVVLLAAAIATGAFYRTAMVKSHQVDAFTSVGSNLGEVEMVGQSGLVAIADAEKAKALAAGIIEEEEEEEVVADDAEGVTIQMTLTTIKSDLKVKFINSETKKLVGSVPFEITVVNPDGSKVTYNDDDKDGIIYKTNLVAGKYKVTPNALPADYSNYSLDTSAQSITIKDTVEMKVVDVSNEVKKESQVNVAKEDTAVKTEVESKLEDTVEWVESKVVESAGNGEETYEKVDNSKVVDPSKTACADNSDIKRLAKGRTTDPSNTASTEASKSDDSSKENSSGTGSGTGSSQSGDNGGTGNTGENGGGGSTTPTPEPDKDMSLSKSSVTLEVGGSSETVTTGVSGTVTAKSDKTSVASVSVSGGSVTIKPEGAGTATITLTADKYKSATISVTVNEKKKGTITVASEASVKVGEIKSLGVSGPSSMTCTSDNTGVVTVDNSGKITGVKVGTATITIKATDYNDATVKVTVTDNEIVPLSKTETTLVEGTTEKITSTNTSLTLEFKSNDTAIATVEKDGTVKAVKEGKTTITVTAKGYKDATFTVNVTKKSGDKVALNEATITLYPKKTQKITAKDTSLKLKFKSGNTAIATVADDGTVTAVAVGETTVTVTDSSGKFADNTVKIVVVSDKELKDTEGNTLYVLENGQYRVATATDYKKDGTYYKKTKKTNKTYYGWQTIDGNTYFFDKNGNKVTGEQVIMGAKYTFNGDGVLTTTAGAMGIDVSKWNGTIDWKAVKNSGVSFVIIRCGYRGSSQGALIEDAKFKSNINGAINAGLKVGVYFFTQAVNEVEAVEEASMVINLCKGYNLSFPVYLDVEASNGRGDSISASQRTANIKAFCGTIQNAGYRAGVYGNKTWLSSYMNTASLTGFKIWLAQYAAAPTYSATRYDMWQYSSKGRVSGISGNVDMNICY